MQYFTEKRFRKRTVILALILCLFLQIVCSAVDYIYAYSVSGNYQYEGWDTAINLISDFVGCVSVFSGYAIIAYLVFLYGLRGGGEWLIALIFGYGLIYFLTFFIGDMVFGLIASLLVVIVLAAVFLIWTKGCREVAVLVFSSMLVPYIGATAILFSTTVVSVDALLLNFMYGFLNLGTDFLVIILFARVADFFRKRAIAKGQGDADISLGGRILPKGNPVLKAFLTIDIIYTAVASIQYILNTVSDLTEYGLPVNANEWMTLLTPYITLAVYFVVGYAVMLLVASRLESSFLLSEEEAQAVQRHS